MTYTSVLERVKKLMKNVRILHRKDGTAFSVSFSPDCPHLISFLFFVAFFALFEQSLFFLLLRTYSGYISAVQCTDCHLHNAL